MKTSVCAALVSGAALLAVPGAGAGATTTLAPAADAHVDQATPTAASVLIVASASV